MNNDHTNLESLMEGSKPRTNGVHFDVTQGVPKEIPNNDDRVAEASHRMPAQAVSSADMSKMDTVNIHDILPPSSKTNPVEESLFADLDAAVNRECESITSRVDAIFEAQSQELSDKAEAEFVNRSHTTSEDIGDDDLGLYDDDTASASTLNRSSYTELNYGTTRDSITLEELNKDRDTYLKTPDPDNGENLTSSDMEENTAPTDVAVDNNSIATEKEESDKEPDITHELRVVSVNSSESGSILDGSDDDDLFEPEPKSTNDTKENVNDTLRDLKGQVQKRSKPNKVIDLAKFTIAQKAVSLQKVMKMAVTSHQHVADWVMYSAGRPISVTGLSGPDILKLNPENSNRNRLNTFRDMYRVMYDHIYDGNKPEFEVWLKQVRFIDLPHIYFALYMATFGGSNFINYSCPKCNKVFIQDIKLEDMVEYANDEVRAKVRSMLKMDTTSPSNDTYPVDLVQISDRYVFGLRAPSVWNVIIETASLSDKFLENHADLIDVVSYIDAIYVIDYENNNLVPVDTKPDPNDQAKTSARRVKAFYDIIHTLSSDEYYELRTKITEYDSGSNDIKYLLPKAECPHCHTEIPANEDITPDNMLFMRHQLAAIGSMSNI